MVSEQKDKVTQEETKEINMAEKSINAELLLVALKHLEQWKEDGYTIIRIDDVIKMIKETLNKA